MDEFYGHCGHCDCPEDFPLDVVPGKEHLEPADPNRYQLRYHMNMQSRPCDGVGKPPHMVVPH